MDYPNKNNDKNFTDAEQELHEIKNQISKDLNLERNLVQDMEDGYENLLRHHRMESETLKELLKESTDTLQKTNEKFNAMSAKTTKLESKHKRMMSSAHRTLFLLKLVSICLAAVLLYYSEELRDMLSIFCMYCLREINWATGVATALAVMVFIKFFPRS